MIDLLFIALGGALGAVLRYVTKLLCGNTTFPFATLTVNLLGCLLIGFLGGICKDFHKSFVVVGLLGAFTTFSSFGLETCDLFMKGNHTLGFLNIAINNILGLGLCFLGLWLGRLIVR